MINKTSRSFPLRTERHHPISGFGHSFTKIRLQCEIAANQAALHAIHHPYFVVSGVRLIANLMMVGSAVTTHNPAQLTGSLIGTASHLMGVVVKFREALDPKSQEEKEVLQQAKERPLSPTYSGHLKQSFGLLSKPFKNWPFTQSFLYMARGISYGRDGILSGRVSETLAALALAAAGISQSELIRPDLIQGRFQLTTRDLNQEQQKSPPTAEEHRRRNARGSALFFYLNTGLMIRVGMTLAPIDHHLMDGGNTLYLGSHGAQYGLSHLDPEKFEQRIARAQHQKEALERSKRPSLAAVIPINSIVPNVESQERIRSLRARRERTSRY